MAIDSSAAFVSYSREDWEFVSRVAKDLKAKGANVWMDKREIHAGDRWELELETALEGCSRMLVILSPASVVSPNVLAEVAFAIDEGKQVIPVFYLDCKIPLRWRPFQYADFRTSYDEGLQELLATLGSNRAEPQQEKTPDQIVLDKAQPAEKQPPEVERPRGHWPMRLMHAEWAVQYEGAIHIVDSEVIFDGLRRLNITWDGKAADSWVIYLLIGKLKSFQRDGHSFEIRVRFATSFSPLVLLMDGVEVPERSVKGDQT